MVTRLQPGATLAGARAELVSLVDKLEPGFKITGATGQTLTKAVLGDIRPMFIALVAAVALLLVIACVVALAPPQIPRLDSVRLDGTVLAIAVGVTVLSVLMFGGLPALIAARVNLASPVRADARSGTESRRRRRVRDWLVASQVALALVLLVCAGLLTRSLRRLQQLDLGYRADHLSIVGLAWDSHAYDTPEKMPVWGERVASALRNVPGMTGVAPIVVPPSVGQNIWLIIALATTRLLRTLLFQVSPTDPITLVGVCAGLLAVASKDRSAWSTHTDCWIAELADLCGNDFFCVGRSSHPESQKKSCFRAIPRNPPVPRPSVGVASKDRSAWSTHTDFSVAEMRGTRGPVRKRLFDAWGEEVSPKANKELFPRHSAKSANSASECRCGGVRRVSAGTSRDAR